MGIGISVERLTQSFGAESRRYLGPEVLSKSRADQNSPAEKEPRACRSTPSRPPCQTSHPKVAYRAIHRSR